MRTLGVALSVLSLSGALALAASGGPAPFELHLAEILVKNEAAIAESRRALGCDPCARYTKDGLTYLFSPVPRLRLTSDKITRLFLGEGPPEPDSVVREHVLLVQLGASALSELRGLTGEQLFRTLVVTASGEPIGVAYTLIFQDMISLAAFPSRAEAERILTALGYKPEIVPFDFDNYQRLQEALRQREGVQAPSEE